MEAEQRYAGKAGAQSEAGGWVVGFGFILFAALMMMLLGGFHMFAGLVGMFDDAFYETPREYATDFSASTWGWIQFIAGLVVLAAAFALLGGAMWARILTVVVALLSAAVNFAFLPYYTAWSIIMIAISIGVIWAVVAHGGDLKHDRD